MKELQITVRLAPRLAERLERLTERLVDNEDFATFAPVTRSMIARRALLLGLKEHERKYSAQLESAPAYEAPEKRVRPPLNVAGRIAVPLAVPAFLVERVERVMPILATDDELPIRGPFPRSSVIDFFIYCGIVELEDTYLPAHERSLFRDLKDPWAGLTPPSDEPRRRPNGEGPRAKRAAAKKESNP